MDVGVALDLGPGEQVLLHAACQAEGIRSKPGRGYWAKIDCLGRTLPGAMDNYETNAAEAGVPGLDRGKRQGGSHGGIDGVAASVQDCHTSEGRIPRLRHHHPAPAGRGRLSDGPVLGDVRRRSVGQGTRPPICFGLAQA